MRVQDPKTKTWHTFSLQLEAYDKAKAPNLYALHIFHHKEDKAGRAIMDSISHVADLYITDKRDERCYFKPTLTILESVEHTRGELKKEGSAAGLLAFAFEYGETLLAGMAYLIDGVKKPHG